MEKSFRPGLKIITIGLSAFCFIFSVWVMVGWFAQTPALAQIHPGFTPTKFNTALCFCLLACVLLPNASRRPLSLFPLGLLPIIPVLTLVQYATGLSFGIDTFFVEAFVTTQSAHPGRMSLYTALCFLALFAVHGALRFQRLSAVIQAIQFGLSTLVLGCSLLAISGYASKVEETYEWYGFPTMALETAILFVLSSFLSLAASIRSISKNQYHRRLASIYTAASLMLVTLWGYHLARISAENDLRQKTAIQTRTYAMTLNSTVENLTKNLERMVGRWESSGGTTESLWRLDAKAHQRDLQGMVGIGYADAASVIRWIEPLQSNQAAVGFRLNSEPTRRSALELAKSSGQTTMTRAIDLKQSGLGFLLISPLANTMEPSGFIYAAIRYSEFFAKHLGAVEYSLVIREGEKTLYKVNADEAPASDYWRSQETFSFHGADWQIILSPTEAAIAQIPLTLAKFILAFGTLTSLSLGFLVLLRQRALDEKAKAAEIARWNDAIVLGSQLAIVATHQDGMIRTYNPAAAELFEYQESEVLGRKTPVLWHDADEIASRARELSQELKADIAAGFQVFTAKADLGQHYQNQWSIVTKSGQRKTVLLVVHALQDQELTISGYVGIFQDITRKLQTDRELQEALSKANEATLTKSRFLANMSHEIRTPINGVLGMAQILLDTKLDTEQRNSVEAIESSGKNLLVIVNDILDLSKIEANKLELEDIDFDLDDLLKGVEQTLGFLARKKGITFHYTLPAAGSPWYLGDPTRLRQVLLNLASNAIKFTDQGSVSIAVGMTPAAGDRQNLRFEVSDTGIGIPQEFIGKLFKPFAQTETSITRRFGGTGLGLCISAQLVHLMKGQIGVLSESGVGSTFWFEVTLPSLPIPAKALNPTPVAAAQKPLRVLVAEDNKVNQIVARKILEKIGHRVDVVANGREVLHSLRSVSYDLILMDCNMPEMDGYEVTQCIRLSTATAYQNIPIIAMTASAMAEDQERCIQAGMTDYISKPFGVQDLDRVIHHVTTDARKTSKSS